MYETSEGPTPFSFCIELQNNVSIEANLILHLQTDEGTASNRDFMSIDKEQSVNGSTCFEIISIFSDDLLEDNETFIISIESRDSRLIVDVSEAQIRIVDENSKTLS